MKKEYRSPELCCIELYTKENIAANDFITGSMSGGYIPDIDDD